MGKLLDAFSPLNFPDLFTSMWVGSLVVIFGAIVVYNIAQRMYRRYPAVLALHEWVFWAILVTWGIVPLLVIVHVPLLMLLLVMIPGLVVAAWATFMKFPPIIDEANDEIRRRRFVPPPRRETRERRRATPAGGHRAHRR
jgi:hypothetical protein